GEGAVAADAGAVGQVHRGLASWLTARVDGGRGPVIYGGSVDVRTAPALLAEPGVEGLFVGRYALDPANFVQIARAPIGQEVPR
ncbi:MAG TPA: triose-phosphate isomerase, partial [Candidatus Limnocylindria bacterium]